MSLKSLIQRLLDSRTTPNEAAHSAMPSYDDNAVIEITPIKTTTDGWEKAASFVATSDGYVLVQGTARNDNVCQLSVDNSKNIKTVMEILRANSTTYFVTPATKGSTVQVFGHYMTNITIKLTKAIGGGYNYLARRALSCLRALSNYLPRSFCKAKGNGLAVKPSLNRESSLVQQLVGMSLQRMVTSVSSIQVVQEAICFLISTQERIQVRHRQIVVSEIVGCFIPTLTWGPLSLLKKGCQSILRPIQSQSRFGSVRQRVGVNLSAGGALC